MSQKFQELRELKETCYLDIKPKKTTRRNNKSVIGDFTIPKFMLTLEEFKEKTT